MNRISIFAAVLCCSVVPAARSYAEEKADVRPDESRVDPTRPAGRTLFVETALEKRIRAALAQPLTHEFKNVSLPELAKFLEEKLKCTVIVDQPALTNEGIEDDETFTHQSRGRSFAVEFQDLLNSSSDWTSRIAFVVRDECLWITTPITAERHVKLRLYQVHDLVVDASDTTVSNPRLEQLRELILCCCGDGWREHSGNYADIKAFEGPGILAFVVVQTDAGHEAIERLLAQLRAAQVDELRTVQQARPERQRREQTDPARQPLPPPPKLPRGKAIDGNQTAAELKIRMLLRQPTKWDFVDKPLGEIVADFEKRFGISIRLDTQALSADGKGPDTRFTLHWLDGEWRNGLSAMLEMHRLTYLVRDDALLVTTLTASETVSRNVVYQVHDLIAEDSALIGRPADFVSLIDVVTGLIAPETWDDEWHCTGFEAPGVQALVVVQGDRYHPRIEALLDLLRDAYDPRVYEAQRRRPVIVPPPHPGTRGMGSGF